MTPGQDNTPFFLVGCVRSGTTLLRDLLRAHPRLESPEETHFFRWADPFGSERYRRMYEKSALMKQHRDLDGVDDYTFLYTLNVARDRKEMMTAYGYHVLKARDNPDGRWFDKTPQNVYGVLLIAAAWPEAQFIHIHRHPLNVVASLMEGAVMPAHGLDGAVNYWLEAMAIMDQFKRLGGDRVKEVCYGELTAKPREAMLDILGFLNEDKRVYPGDLNKVHAEKNKYRNKLDAAQVADVLERTATFRERYGYGDAP
jgi:hypothetical protein